MKSIFSKLMVILGLALFTSCGGGHNTDVVESGTYKGTIVEVEPSKDEIYVETDDGKTLELYFTEETTLTENNEEVSFSVLEENDKVEVDVKKTGKRLDPLSVKILIPNE